jgi:predicted metalloprotease
MRWTPGGTSSDIEDRRDEGGGGGGLRGIHLGCGGFLILLVLSVLFRQNFFALLTQVPSDSGGVTTSAPGPGTPAGSRSAEEERRVQFVSFVLDDAQKTWDRLLPDEAGVAYQHAKLVLFRDGIESACGFAQSASGPFYCPGDHEVYIDLGFYDELRRRFGAGGEFAQAYVIAHELGHHVQRLLGTEAKVRRLQESQPRQGNALSVRMELQADCYAGIWGNSTARRDILEQGDVESALNAAAAIGDDRIQRMSTGHVVPESFTHGSSAQRVEWFKRGLSTGSLGACDTFSR